MTADRCKTPLLWLMFVVSTTLLSLGTAKTARSGCRGDTIQLFQNIKIDDDNTTLSLYRKNRPMVIWSIKSSVVNATFANGYSDKLSFDKTQNIYIHELQDSDEANYTIISKTGNTTWTDQVKLAVFVEPETRCKPKIILGVDTLTTYLEPDGCGKPATYAYFLEHPGISVVHNEIKLQPGQSAGIVYACIDGPSLRCAKNTKLSDYCTVFIHETNFYREQSGIMTLQICTNSANLQANSVKLLFRLTMDARHGPYNNMQVIRQSTLADNIQSKLSDISGVTIATLVVTILYDGSFILVIIVLYRHLTDLLKKNANTTNLSAAIENRNQNTGSNMYKTERILSYLIETEFSHGDEEIDRIDEKLLQNAEEPVCMLEETVRANSAPNQIFEGSDALCIVGEKRVADSTPPHEAEQTVPQTEDEKTSGCTPKDQSDPKYDKKESTTEHQACNDSESMRELQELRHAAVCKICLANKMSIVFRPCNHIATCSYCSTSFQRCPVCRAAINEKMTVHFDSTL